MNNDEARMLTNEDRVKLTKNVPKYELEAGQEFPIINTSKMTEVIKSGAEVTRMFVTIMTIGYRKISLPAEILEKVK